MENSNEVSSVDVVVLVEDELAMVAHITPTDKQGYAECELSLPDDIDARAMSELFSKLSDELMHIAYIRRVQSLADAQREKQQSNGGSAANTQSDGSVGVDLSVDDLPF